MKKEICSQIIDSVSNIFVSLYILKNKIIRYEYNYFIWRDNFCV